MPSLADHPASSIVRLLNIGESGTGKTGCLASLALAGYNLWILDFDNGLDILVNLLRDHPDALARVNYKTLRDTVTMTNGIPKLKIPTVAWKNAGRTLVEWGAEQFTPRDVVVIDTLTSASHAAFNEALALQGRLNQRPQQSDYGWMADSVLLFIDGMTTDDANFNFIVNTHIRYLAGNDDDQTTSRGLPNAKGQQIPKDVGKYFNTITLCRSIGQGRATRRVLSTQPQGVIEVKSSNPITVKPEYPIDTGLRDLFADILGHGPNTKSVTTPSIKEQLNA